MASWILKGETSLPISEKDKVCVVPTKTWWADIKTLKAALLTGHHPACTTLHEKVQLTLCR